MITNLPEQKIPHELSQYLKGKQVDFIVKNNKDYYEIISIIMLTGFSLYVVAIVLSNIVDLRIYRIFFNKTSTTFDYIKLLILLSIIFFYIKLLFSSSSYFRDLFKPPAIFAGTDQYLVVYYDNQIMSLSWEHFNRSTLVFLTGKHKGNIIFRLYNDRKIINEYDGTEVKPENIIISEVEYADELEIIIRKHIDMIQGE